MNEYHEIYEAPEDTIPKEDKARLDGYLFGRAEGTLLSHSREASLTRFGKGKMASSISTKKKRKGKNKF